MAIIQELKWPEHFVILNTDDEDILKMVEIRSWPCTAYRRPERLAQDDSSMIDTIRNMILEKKLSSQDIIVLLQPTSPLRSSQDIAQAIQMFLTKVQPNGGSSLVSVCKAMNDPTTIIDIKENGKPVVSERGDFYFVNGAIYINTVDFLMQHQTFYCPILSELFVMPKLRSIDINDTEDMDMAWYIGRGRQSHLKEQEEQNNGRSNII